MATLAANVTRVYEANEDPLFTDVPIIANDIVYEGAAVGDSSGTARPLVAADVFVGFCAEKVDNTGGAASAKNVKVRQQGTILLPVVGASSTNDIGTDVYATDDNTFTLTASGASSIGTISRWVSGTYCMVRFQGSAARSI